MIAHAGLRTDSEDAPIRSVDAAGALALARNVLETEADAIRSLAARLGTPFVAALELMLRCRGRVVVSGIGKSGHVARKLAATLASTGTPAFFVHPAEAGHGDLGMITADDVVVMLSNSGETDELVLLTPHLKRQGAKLIALTGNDRSALAQSADVHLDAGVDAEACPLGLAPTASTTAALALGDALALALLDARGFSVEDFARSHPGAPLGRRLLTLVRDGQADTVVAVYVPTNHLYLGDVIICHRDKASYPDITVEQGIRIFLTGGMALSARLKARQGTDRVGDFRV